MAQNTKITSQNLEEAIPDKKSGEAAKTTSGIKGRNGSNAAAVALAVAKKGDDQKQDSKKKK